MDFLIRLWESQKGICFYTGEVLSLDRGRSKWNSASLDRIDPSQGYVIGNVVWTSRTAKEFLAFCEKVIAHMGQQKVSG